MAKIAVEALATAATISITGSGAIGYDKTKWSLGSLIKKRTDLGTPFIGPIVNAVGTPYEGGPSVGLQFNQVISWSSDVDWVFFSEITAAAATRRIILYEFTKSTAQFQYKGMVTINTFTGNLTQKGMKISYEKYSIGTASVSGTAVTGTSTNWLINNMSIGSRIGFGSTDPTQITTWYPITAIGSDTGITLGVSAPVIGNGAYVIEDIKILSAMTSATVGMGGLYLTQGVRYEDFGLATSFANQSTTGVSSINKGTYLLSDAALTGCKAAVGLALAPKTDWLNQMVYLTENSTASNLTIYVFNIRKTKVTTTADSVTTAVFKDIGCRVLTTGNQTYNGTLVTAGQNGLYAVAKHGPLANTPAIYFVTATKIQACPVSLITAASTNFITQTMTETPPGGTAALSATSAITYVDYDDYVDRFVIFTSGATAFRHYISQFRTDSLPMDHCLLLDTKQINQTTIDVNLAKYPNTQSINICPSVTNGVLYLNTQGTSTTTSFIYTIPMGADWTYSSLNGQYAISPEIPTPNCNKYARFYAIRDKFIGGELLGKPADPFKSSFRTTGINDNSGSWTALSDGNDLSSIAGASSIQFRLDFKCISDFCIPSRIFSIGVVYDNLDTDSHYQPSANFSNITTKTFAWRFATAFTTTVPTLRIRLYDAVSGALYVDDTTVGSTGIWDKSTNDGSTWLGSYNTTDKANETTYIRYTPASLADNIKVRALLTLN